MALSRPVMIGAAVAVLAAGAIGTVAAIASTLPTTPASRVVAASGEEEISGGLCAAWTVTGELSGDLREVPAWMVWEHARGGADLDATLHDPSFEVEFLDGCGGAPVELKSVNVTWAAARECPTLLASPGDPETLDGGATAIGCGDEALPSLDGDFGAEDGPYSRVVVASTGGERPLGRIVARDNGEVCFWALTALAYEGESTTSDSTTMGFQVCA